MNKLLLPTTSVALMMAMQGSLAKDYVLDATTMAVGATAGENLVVKEGCLDPRKTSCTDKFKWLSSTSPIKIGNLQVLGQLTGDYEVVITADFGGDPKGIKLLTADNQEISLTFNGDRGWAKFMPNGIGNGGKLIHEILPGWNKYHNFNEVKITVQQGVANLYTNGSVMGEPITFDAGQVFDRVAFEGITANDRIADVKVRGMQTLASCGTPSSAPSSPAAPAAASGDCTADYIDGSLHVPCVRVPNAFGKIDLYDIWLLQQPLSFTFDLDSNRVTLK
ncbi:MAG: hypothetical protein DRR16_21095 [Candidatus Parabeggiatoa sp. nov. 3]|nr:MAG: hypothetical protein DRR00_13350 [Gammaproteobacteria bacterium]RKZ65281.1 MAG: hypothetical protein DRQ99_13085 [Gammaproteobacteria bacterium]RKZ81869.1 MAG: hypothetical protein DRR16_21095 [Gammaproteobacteria bacterium]